MSSADQRDAFAERAKEIRRMADAATDPEIRATLEATARSYEQLVADANRKAALWWLPSPI